MISIIERVGTEFVRVRIGIGRPPAGVEVADYVLSAPANGERAALRDGIQRAGEAIECVLVEGIEAAMSRFNGRAPTAPN